MWTLLAKNGSQQHILCCHLCCSRIYFSKSQHFKLKESYFFSYPDNSQFAMMPWSTFRYGEGLWQSLILFLSIIVVHVCVHNNYTYVDIGSKNNLLAFSYMFLEVLKNISVKNCVYEKTYWITSRQCKLEIVAKMQIQL